jgi:hypothetical protein
LGRAAAAIEVGDLCLAGIETVLLRLPDLTPSALAKLAELEKGGTTWQDEPRVPPGSRTAVNGRQGKAQTARPPSPPSPRRSSLLARPLPLKIPVSRSTTESIGPGSTTRTSF